VCKSRPRSHVGCWCAAETPTRWKRKGDPGNRRTPPGVEDRTLRCPYVNKLRLATPPSRPSDDNRHGVGSIAEAGMASRVMNARRRAIAGIARTWGSRPQCVPKISHLTAGGDGVSTATRTLDIAQIGLRTSCSGIAKEHAHCDQMEDRRSLSAAKLKNRRAGCGCVTNHSFDFTVARQSD